MSSTGKIEPERPVSKINSYLICFTELSPSARSHPPHREGGMTWTRTARRVPRREGWVKGSSNRTIDVTRGLRQ